MEDIDVMTISDSLANEILFDALEKNQLVQKMVRMYPNHRLGVFTWFDMEQNKIKIDVTLFGQSKKEEK